MHNYCSVLSKDYIHRGLLLYNSLKTYDHDFRLFFVCLNNEVESLLKLMALEHIVILNIQQIEEQDTELAAVKASRNNKEYSWTSKGSILLYLFNNFPEMDHIVWLDSDILFYSNPDPIFEELNKCSILLTKERFTNMNIDLNNVFGIFNTGMMGFKRDENALQCLQTYRWKCINWCYDIIEPGRWSDQMYANYWPWVFENVKVVTGHGINATAWNIQNAPVETRDGTIYIGDEKLIFYHYSGFRYNNYKEYDLCCYINLPETAKKLIYLPYVKKHQAMIDTVNSYVNNFYNGMSYQEYKYTNYFCLNNKTKADKCDHSFCTITTNGYLLRCLALYESINRNTKGNFHIWICAVDNAACELLKKMELPHATIIPVNEIENESLISAKNNRYQNEYCWTIKASLMKYILSQNQMISSIIYLDSDIYLFSNPSSLFSNLKVNDVLLTSHNFTPGFSQLNEQKGRYNAGIVGFKNSKSAMQLLNWWERKCIEWCYNQIEPNRFADQKYLEMFSKKYSKTAIINSLGVNTAMWNIDKRTVKKSGMDTFINEDVLVAYHFSSFCVISEKDFDLWHSPYMNVEGDVKELIYLPYVNSIIDAVRLVKYYEANLDAYLSDISYDSTIYNHFAVT